MNESIIKALDKLIAAHEKIADVDDADNVATPMEKIASARFVKELKAVRDAGKRCDQDASVPDEPEPIILYG